MDVGGRIAVKIAAEISRVENLNLSDQYEHVRMNG